MGEHTKTELHLSEEQLQAISGGCAQCEQDRTRVVHHTNSANLNHWRAQTARNLEILDLAEEYSQQARMHSLTAERIQNEIDARHPAGSSNAEPAAKRQRLR